MKKLLFYILIVLSSCKRYDPPLDTCENLCGDGGWKQLFGNLDTSFYCYCYNGENFICSKDLFCINAKIKEKE